MERHARRCRVRREERDVKVSPSDVRTAGVAIAVGELG
jgi:hypothetical protein